MTAITTEFDRALAKELILEGGFVNHPKDPGRATMKGITQAVYDTYRKSVGAGRQSVRCISDDEVRAIYRGRYWNLIKGDSLPPGVGFVVFDGAVNSGPAQSVKWLQRALGLDRVDGLVGPQTLQAVAAVNDHDALIERVLKLRDAFLKALKTWSTFGKGWTNRLRQVLAVGQSWARGSVGPDVVYDAVGAAKALSSDAKAAPSAALADAVTGGSAIVGALQTAQTQLAPLAAGSAAISNIVAGIVVVSAVLTIGGALYGWWARRRRAELAEALA
ncbi:glycoside hydrolase family 108 protein [Pleomorphomonas sp. JP5]|uniref:glycoside hydrolase family 108 protein n=1 Tax=Pleomorphomonas sp. JP5 TaxID=2942998 RepID=UPI0020438317|nr:glycoside hydrolase family 108 protein [Pleomorphomonas sp. JP5]MCM5560326.1 glycoside hydrolase family 108 protein [Pleomorphomonas sp. JP5]